MSLKSKAIFLVGNYGVGKSTIIKSEVLKKEDEIFLNIGENLFVLGTQINGADSLSKFRKEDVFKKILKNKGKNIIITGNYYCQIKDFTTLKGHFDLVLIYLKTTYKNNALRIAKRGKHINVDTYNAKLKNQVSLIKKVKGFTKVVLLDNNQSIEKTRNEFYKIVKDEKD